MKTPQIATLSTLSDLYSLPIMHSIWSSLLSPILTPAFSFLQHGQVPVWAVLDYTLNKKIERELLLVKISILGPEYFEDQLHAKSNSLYPAQLTSQPISDTPTPETPSESGHLSPSEALRQKHMHLQALTSLASHFAGKVVDVSNDSAIIELCAKTSRIDAFLKLVRPYGILEAARTGTMVMPRASIQSEWQGLADGEEAAEGEAIDAVSLLSPQRVSLLLTGFTDVTTPLLGSAASGINAAIHEYIPSTVDT